MPSCPLRASASTRPSNIWYSTITKRLHIFQNWASAVLSPNFEIFAKPGTFNVTSEARNFTGTAIQHVDDVSSEADLTVYANSAGPAVLDGNAIDATSGDAVGSEGSRRGSFARSLAGSGLQMPCLG